MGALLEHVIRVNDASRLAAWYNKVMGMTVEDLGGGNWAAFYPGPGVKLIFKELGGKGAAYKSSSDSVYWKIGVTLPDVALARERILKSGTVGVSAPSQFKDIGFMCHLTDPNGFTIELLQHKFEKNFVKKVADDSLALGQSAVIGQITTRSSNIQEALKVYQDTLGMKLLSIQDVSAYGFVLYFLGFTTETPPVPEGEDLNSVAVREWLWERPYTTLEIQVKPGQPTQPMVGEGEGVSHLTFQVDNVDEKREGLATLGLRSSGDFIMDKDGVNIRLV